jgi:hypothetical protein
VDCIILLCVTLRYKNRKGTDSNVLTYKLISGVEGVVRGLEGVHLADSCILTELE